MKSSDKKVLYKLILTAVAILFVVIFIRSQAHATENIDPEKPYGISAELSNDGSKLIVFARVIIDVVPTPPSNISLDIAVSAVINGSVTSKKKELRYTAQWPFIYSQEVIKKTVVSFSPEKENPWTIKHTETGVGEPTIQKEYTEFIHTYALIALIFFIGHFFNSCLWRLPCKSIVIKKYPALSLIWSVGITTAWALGFILDRGPLLISLSIVLLALTVASVAYVEKKYFQRTRKTVPLGAMLLSGLGLHIFYREPFLVVEMIAWFVFGFILLFIISKYREMSQKKKSA